MDEKQAFLENLDKAIQNGEISVDEIPEEALADLHAFKSQAAPEAVNPDDQVLGGEGLSGKLEYLDAAGAPTRSGISALLKGENPFTAGYEQLGKDPSLAPTGKEIIEQTGIVPEAQATPGRMVSDLNFRNVRPQTQESVDKAQDLGREALGAGVEMVADPLNAAISGAAKLGGAAVKTMNTALKKGLAKVLAGSDNVENFLKNAGKFTDESGNLIETTADMAPRAVQKTFEAGIKESQKAKSLIDPTKKVNIKPLWDKIDEIEKNAKRHSDTDVLNYIEQIKKEIQIVQPGAASAKMTEIPALRAKDFQEMLDQDVVAQSPILGKFQPSVNSAIFKMRGTLRDGLRQVGSDEYKKAMDSSHEIFDALGDVNRKFGNENLGTNTIIKRVKEAYSDSPDIAKGKAPPKKELKALQKMQDISKEPILDLSKFQDAQKAIVETDIPIPYAGKYLPKFSTEGLLKESSDPAKLFMGAGVLSKEALKPQQNQGSIYDVIGGQP